MTELREKLTIPAGNTAGLRLALPEPYNLQHGTGPVRIGMRLAAANVLALKMPFPATEVPPYPDGLKFAKIVKMRTQIERSPNRDMFRFGRNEEKI